MRWLPFLFLALLLPLPAQTPSKPFQKIENCQWKADRWNDGDSFHATLGDGRGEIVVRLSFVDSPEDETAYLARIGEQAEYFGITPEQAKEVAHEAAAFTAQRLAKPFTVWTRWNSALGRSVLGRVYCIIITADGRGHHIFGFSVWMAGGGIKGGTVHGSTDEFGFAAVENAVSAHDFHATILHLMSLDHERITYRYSDRDFRLTDVHGNLVKEILA